MLDMWQKILGVFKPVQAQENSWREGLTRMQFRRMWEVFPPFGPAEASWFDT